MSERKISADQVRVTDAQRREMVDTLGRAFAAGCLTIGEFEQRVGSAWAAVTRAELATLRADLPVTLPALGPPPRPRIGTMIRPVVRQLSTWWLILSALTIALWGLLTIGGGPDAAQQWWIWPVGGGAALLVPLWHIATRDDPHPRS